MAGSWKGGGTCIARLVSTADIPKDLRKQILVDERTEKAYIFREETGFRTYCKTIAST